MKHTTYTPNLFEPWTEEEDEGLMAAVLNHGTRWGLLNQLMPSRTEDALRQRWHQTIKKRMADAGTENPVGRKAQKYNGDLPSKWTPWTDEEDKIILAGSGSQGGKWRELAKMLPRRTDSSVRNRWGRLQQERKQGGVRRVRSAAPASPPVLPPAAVFPSIPIPHNQMMYFPAQSFPTSCCVPTFASAPFTTEAEILRAPSSGALGIAMPYTAQTGCSLAPSVPSVPLFESVMSASTFSQGHPISPFPSQSTVAAGLAGFDYSVSGSCEFNSPWLYLATPASGSMLTSDYEVPAAMASTSASIGMGAVAMPCCNTIASAAMACVPRSGRSLVPSISIAVTPSEIKMDNQIKIAMPFGDVVPDCMPQHMVMTKSTSTPCIDSVPVATPLSAETNTRTIWSTVCLGDVAFTETLHPARSGSEARSDSLTARSLSDATSTWAEDGSTPPSINSYNESPLRRDSPSPKVPCETEAAGMCHPAQPASLTDSDVASSWLKEESSSSSAYSETAPFDLSPRSLHALDFESELLFSQSDGPFPLPSLPPSAPQTPTHRILHSAPLKPGSLASVQPSEPTETPSMHTLTLVFSDPAIEEECRMSRVLYVRSMLSSGSPQYWQFTFHGACVVFAGLLGILGQVENSSLSGMNSPTLRNTTMIALVPGTMTLCISLYLKLRMPELPLDNKDSCISGFSNILSVAMTRGVTITFLWYMPCQPVMATPDLGGALRDACFMLIFCVQCHAAFISPRAKLIVFTLPPLAHVLKPVWGIGAATETPLVLSGLLLGCAIGYLIEWRLRVRFLRTHMRMRAAPLEATPLKEASPVKAAERSSIWESWCLKTRVGCFITVAFVPTAIIIQVMG